MQAPTGYRRESVMVLTYLGSATMILWIRAHTHEVSEHYGLGTLAARTWAVEFAYIDVLHRLHRTKDVESHF